MINADDGSRNGKKVMSQGGWSRQPFQALRSAPRHRCPHQQRDMVTAITQQQKRNMSEGLSRLNYIVLGGRGAVAVLPLWLR